MTSRTCFALLLAFLAFGASAATLTGRIVGVSDGDTITLLTADKVQHRIRIAAIDAPESKQAFGTRAKQSMSALAYNRQANAECYKQDRYGAAVLLVARRSECKISQQCSPVGECVCMAGRTVAGIEMAALPDGARRPS